MGQIADQFTIQLLMRKNFFFADNFYLLVLLVEFQRQALSFSGCGGAGSVQNRGGGGFERQFVLAETGVVFDHLIEHCK